MPAAVLVSVAVSVAFAVRSAPTTGDDEGERPEVLRTVSAADADTRMSHLSRRLGETGARSPTDPLGGERRG
ncbi:hypothetical protein, partial [Streptomyces alkaliphilus]|uniref:hypothetical protein n=1 Tax=Streptomyces alkaliphilus TaxID=1472722 RepID=UPI001E3FA57D